MILFIGDEKSARPYRLFGIDTRVAETPEEAEDVLREISAGTTAAVFMTEDLFDKAGGFARSIGMHVVAVPGVRGKTGNAGKHIREMLQKALGTEIKE